MEKKLLRAFERRSKADKREGRTFKTGTGMDIGSRLSSLADSNFQNPFDTTSASTESGLALRF
jgi:hypothetical protein